MAVNTKFKVEATSYKSSNVQMTK